MKKQTTVVIATLLPLLLGAGSAWAEPVRDCVLEGTVKERGDDPEKVFTKLSYKCHGAVLAVT